MARIMILVRHAEYTGNRLSPIGCDHARDLGQRIQGLMREGEPVVFAASWASRAKQTAQIIGQVLGSDGEIKSKFFLAPAHNEELLENLGELAQWVGQTPGLVVCVTHVEVVRSITQYEGFSGFRHLGEELTRDGLSRAEYAAGAVVDFDDMTIGLIRHDD